MKVIILNSPSVETAKEALKLNNIELPSLATSESLAKMVDEVLQIAHEKSGGKNNHY